MTTGNCRLCGNNGELKESHIIPKFVFRWMKKTGGSYFRDSINPEKRRQDGIKEHLLCDDCEQRFSSREAYFKQIIFDPYINNATQSIVYDERLFYFCISVAWRTLVHSSRHEDIGTHHFADKLHEAEIEWRDFLLTEVCPPTYSETHLFCTGLLSGNTQPVGRPNLYLARTVDGTITSNEIACTVYWKLARFVSFSAITPFDQSLWINTRVNPSGGVLQIPQKLLDGTLGSFMENRARLVAEATKTPLTDKQERFHDERVAANPSAILNSDLGKVMRADASIPVDPHVHYRPVGRNDRCPCGSGKKYKKCHGQ